MLNFLRNWWHLFTLYGGGKGGGYAPPPDYRGAAAEQAAASKEIATQTTWANRPTLNTPWGQQTWGATAGVDPATGQAITQWTSDINLTPEQQEALNAQQNIQAGRSTGAQTLLGQAVKNFQTPMDWGALPGRAAGLNAATDYRPAQQRAYQTMSQMLQPGRTYQQSQLDTQLANMGLTRGSAAFNAEQQRLQDQWTSQDKQMMAEALKEGRADVGGLFGMQQQAQGFQQQLRQQAISEEAARRGQTLNELNALLTGQQVSMPQMPSFNQATQPEAPQYLAAAQAAGDYNMNMAKLDQSSGPDIGKLIGTGASVAASFGL